MGPRRPNPYCRSRVTPGTSATMASRVPVNTLKSVDLPTLGRPTRAMTGSTACSLGRRRAECSYPPTIVDHEKQTARKDWRIAHTLAAARHASDERTGGFIQPMHIALKI